MVLPIAEVGDEIFSNLTRRILSCVPVEALPFIETAAPDASVVVRSLDEAVDWILNS